MAVPADAEADGCLADAPCVAQVLAAIERVVGVAQRGDLGRVAAVLGLFVVLIGQRADVAGHNVGYRRGDGLFLAVVGEAALAPAQFHGARGDGVGLLGALGGQLIVWVVKTGRLGGVGARVGLSAVLNGDGAGVAAHQTRGLGGDADGLAVVDQVFVAAPLEADGLGRDVGRVGQLAGGQLVVVAPVAVERDGDFDGLVRTRVGVHEGEHAAGGGILVQHRAGQRDGAGGGSVAVVNLIRYGADGGRERGPVHLHGDVLLHRVVVGRVGGCESRAVALLARVADEGTAVVPRPALGQSDAAELVAVGGCEAGGHGVVRSGLVDADADGAALNGLALAPVRGRDLDGVAAAVVYVFDGQGAVGLAVELFAALVPLVGVGDARNVRGRSGEGDFRAVGDLSFAGSQAHRGRVQRPLRGEGEVGGDLSALKVPLGVAIVPAVERVAVAGDGGRGDGVIIGKAADVLHLAAAVFVEGDGESDVAVLHSVSLLLAVRRSRRGLHSDGDSRSGGKAGELRRTGYPVFAAGTVLHAFGHGNRAVSLALDALACDDYLIAGCSGSGRDSELRPAGGIVGTGFGFAYVQRLAEIIGDGAAGYLRAAALRGVDLVAVLNCDGLGLVVDGIALVGCWRGLSRLDDVEIDRGFAGVVAGEVDDHAAGADVDIFAVVKGVVRALGQRLIAVLDDRLGLNGAAGVVLVCDVRNSEAAAAVIALFADGHGHSVTGGAGCRAAAVDGSGDGAIVIIGALIRGIRDVIVSAGSSVNDSAAYAAVRGV